MSTHQRGRELGMDRPIARRDFLNGVAIGVTAGVTALNSAQAQTSSASPAVAYPPSRAGLRGNYPAAVEEFELIGEGKYARSAISDAEMQEQYDLVIVGGGISGLSAAYFYRTALGPDATILILDNHDDFGGHAKRNEFHFQGKTFIGFGGTMGIATPYPYSYCAKALIRELGVPVERNAEFLNRDLEQKYGLEQREPSSTKSTSAKIGWSRATRVCRNSSPKRRSPMPRARTSFACMARIRDYLEGMSLQAKRAKLAKMSYQDYLLNVAQHEPRCAALFHGQRRPEQQARRHHAGARSGAARAGGFQRAAAWNWRSPSMKAPTCFIFPMAMRPLPGCWSRKLVPAALPGQQSMDTIVAARVAYDKLDDPSSKTRIRLSSPVVRVENDADAFWSPIAAPAKLAAFARATASWRATTH